MSARPARRRVVLAALVVVVLLLAVTSATWVSGTAPTVIGTEPVSVAGTSAAPAVTAAALVMGAAALAVAIGRRVAVTLGGLALLGAGVMVVVAVAGLLADPAGPLLGAAALVSGVRVLEGEPALTPWPYAAALLGAGAGAAGVVAVLSAGRWQHAGRRFERAGAAASAGGPTGASPVGPTGASPDSATTAPGEAATRPAGAAGLAVGTEQGGAAAAPGAARGTPETDARTRAMDDWDALGRGEDPSRDQAP
ncbi:Trp biosynthesis-associated membrane protein [Georgenia muralis]